LDSPSPSPPGSAEAHRRGRPRRFWARRIARIALGVLLVVACLGLAGFPVYVRPQIDPLSKADAIFVLGGYGDDRYQLGKQLVEEQWAPVLVESGGYQHIALWNRCLTPGPPVNIVCFVASPPTTNGEAQELKRFADKYGWRKVIVITHRSHVSRARFILQRCFDGELTMIASRDSLSLPRWVYEYAYQTAGYVKALLSPKC